MFRVEASPQPSLIVGAAYGSISWSCSGGDSRAEVRTIKASRDRPRNPASRHHHQEECPVDDHSFAVANIVLVCLTSLAAASSCASLLTLNGIAQEVQHGSPSPLHSDNTYLIALAIYVFSTALFCHLRRLAGDTTVRLSLALGMTLGMGCAAFLAMDHIQVFLLFIPGSCWIALMAAWAWSIVSWPRPDQPDVREAQLLARAEKMEEGGNPTDPISTNSG